MHFLCRPVNYTLAGIYTPKLPCILPQRSGQTVRQSNSMPSVPRLLVMAALRSRCGHEIFALWFLSSSIFFFLSSPNLSRPSLDVYHNLHTCCGLSANLECRSETCCTRLAEIQDAKKSPSGHHRTTLSGYIFANKACIDNRKETC